MHRKNLYQFYCGTSAHPVSWVNGVPKSNLITYNQLETNHQFIQWWFPTLEQSKTQPGQPFLTQADVEQFRKNKEAQALLRARFHLMLDFYGLSISPHTHTLEKNNHFSARSRQWLTDGNHNLLRLTRMMNSLVTLGLWQEAVALYQGLEKITHGKVSTKTMAIWRNTLTKHATKEEKCKIEQKLTSGSQTTPVKQKPTPERQTTPCLSQSKMNFYAPKTRAFTKPHQTRANDNFDQTVSNKIKNQVANLESAPLTAKGNLDNTYKVAFQNSDSALKFIEHLKNIYGNDILSKYEISYYGDQERYPMSKDGVRYAHIIRFERSMGAHFSMLMYDYLHHLNLPKPAIEQFVKSAHAQEDKHTHQRKIH